MPTPTPALPVPAATIGYDSLMRSLRTTINIGELPVQDKVRLCHALMEDLGIIRKFWENPSDTEAATRIIDKCYDLALSRPVLP